MSEPIATPRKWTRCTGKQLRKLAEAGLIWLEKHQQHCNELNVFPVPDGDTGTNMVLTMRSASSRLQDQEHEHAGRMADTLAQGALMGARGNSGVILSQIWRGLAKALKDLDTFDVQDLSRAFQEASDTAYGGVMRPVEGTILTVIREGSEEAADAAGKSTDLRFLLERVLERCQQSLLRTPDLLPILKQAGVVDAGGQGLVYILEGMLRYVHGELAELDRVEPAVVTRQPAQALVVPEGGELENPYDVQFILMGESLSVEEVRDSIDAMGDSTVVVGDESTIKVHIHVKDPGLPLSFGSSLGSVTDVVVENMQMQMEEIVYESGTALAPDNLASPVEPGQIAVIAIAPGNGLEQIFRSLGAAETVSGGQTNNPSTEEILRAVEKLPTDKVVILPNNKNILLASEAARELSSKSVVVVPTKTIPQGMSAILCHNPHGNLDETSSAMVSAANHVASGQITRATRDVTLDGVKVAQGELIGIADGRLCVSGPEINEVILGTLAGMDLASREIVSVYYGEDISPVDAQATAKQIEGLYPGVEIELLEGGQPHYFYILGAE
jgi:DAK2 domain fusion protein YloV